LAEKGWGGFCSFQANIRPGHPNPLRVARSRAAALAACLSLGKPGHSYACS
jgi:hypothetical protein